MKYFIIILITLIFISCVPGPIDESQGGIIGRVNSELDANKSFIRVEEAPIGNMIADAIKEYLDKNEEAVDLVIMNAGGIRYNKNERPTGIYPLGDYTAGMIAEILPFSNIIVITYISGKDIKEIFEHSVSALPDAQGRFLQVSKGFKVVINTANTAEVLNSEEDTIVIPGNRVMSLKLNGEPLKDSRIYKVASTDYIAYGGDNYLTLKNLKNEQRKNVLIGIKTALKRYIQSNSPIPIVEGRIIIN
jgi:2',3'-cyclic-nucleotide 2'-phosphodiesterase (5'-nucleotidase family)